MAGTFTVLSWNVETFGETKADVAQNFIAAVVAQLNVDLVVFMENTMYGQTEVVRGLTEVLRAVSGQRWWGLGTDPTGKSLALPQVVTYASFPKIVDRSAYWLTLQACYTDDTAKKQLVLKSGYSKNDEWNCREALERAGILRRDLETYTGFFRYDKAFYDATKLYMALGSWVRMGPVGAISLNSFDAAGNQIGYGDPTSTFTGRWPCIYQLWFANPAQPSDVTAALPLVSFHAPFGTDLDARVDANVGLMRLGTPALPSGLLDIKDQPNALVAGDFNIDYDWTKPVAGLKNPISDSQPRSVRNYGSFLLENFQIPIAEASSLKPIDKADPTWTDPKAFRSSAYDNIMVKAAPGGPITAVAGSILDLITLTYNRNAASPNYLAKVGGIPATPNLYSAFAYYRKNISDHLPAFCQLTVPGRP